MSQTIQAVASLASGKFPAAVARPELLAPAGDWECAKAAVENGADAIYFGLDRFNARMRAHNFTVADLPRLMEFLHGRGVRGYVTFNTLVFANEIESAADYLKSIISAGVDAAIVQDVGVCRMIRALSPDFPIHTSTQMTVTSAAGVEFAKKLGAQLVVLARENSIAEIEKIRAALATRSEELGSDVALPLEVFVHGALCVAYSGQCLTSESLGGRSANRGECAQACRMTYDLVSDGKDVDLGGRRYLLSPQDLSGLDVLPELVRAGVASLKIEGRLKSPEYVASITRVYREALDRAAMGASATAEETRAARYDLEMGFSRGLSTGWFGGINNQRLVHARFGTKRGVLLGEVTRIVGESVFVRLQAPLQPGDGVVFDAGKPEAGEQGGRVYSVDILPEGARLTFGNGDIDFRRVSIGNRLWKNNDPHLERRARASFAGEAPRFQRPIFAEVHGQLGTSLTLIVRDENGLSVQVASEIPLVAASNKPLTEETLRAQLGRLGGTEFFLEKLRAEIASGLMLPVSELNRLRREAVSQLRGLRAKPQRWQLVADGAERARAELFSTIEKSPEATPEIIVVIRHLHQLEAAWETGARTIYAEFEDPKKYRDAVKLFRSLQAMAPDGAAGNFWVAPPRIFKPGEEWILKQVRSCEADGYLVRNYDHLRFFADCRRRGDFSLNVANPFTASYYLQEQQLERVTASYDLNIEQLEALLSSAPAERFDVTLHQHMPMFHMEHCVFCAFLSKGTDYTNCGRPCDKHDVQLRDRIGMLNPLKADAGCRNTVYNARAQTGAEFAAKLLQRGARHFRVEFLNESGDELGRIVRRYRQLIAGEISGAELWREFKFINQIGVTRGQLEGNTRASS